VLERRKRGRRGGNKKGKKERELALLIREREAVEQNFSQSAEKTSLSERVVVLLKT